MTTTSIADFSIFTNKYSPMGYPTTKSLDEFVNIATYNVSALSYEGMSYNLILGGSSNIILEGANAMKIYTSSNGVQYYTTTVSNGSNDRTDDQYFGITHSNNMTYFNSPYNVHYGFDERFSFNSVTFDTSRGNRDILATSKSLLEVQSNVNIRGTLDQEGPMIARSTLTVCGNLMADSNFRCNKAIYGSNLNVFRHRCSNGVETVGYGFQVNTSNQLELIKTTLFTDSNLVSKKVAVFGWNELQTTDTSDASYLVFNELKGLGVTCDGTGSNPDFNSGGFLSVDGGNMYGDIDMKLNSMSNVLNLGVTNVTASNVSALLYETVGSDYAEYIERANPEEIFLKSQVIGLNGHGQVTSRFDEAVRFMIISDDAGVIGGKSNANTEIVAFCGRVRTQLPVSKCVSGDYLVPQRRSDGGIAVKPIGSSALDFIGYISSIGQVISIGSDNIPLVIVK